MGRYVSIAMTDGFRVAFVDNFWYRVDIRRRLQSAATTRRRGIH